MKLTHATVTNFRCVDDSTLFSIGEITCLVGKNESGKTSVLHALERLNPINPKITKLDKLRDYPRHKLTEFDEDDEVARTEWTLGDDDVKAVEDILGSGALKNRTVQVTKPYKAKTTWSVAIDEKAVIKTLLSEAACDTAERTLFSACKTTSDLKTAADGVPEKSPRVAALLERINEFRDGDAMLASIDILHPRMPKFLYFASYDRMDGNVHLESVATRQQSSQLTRSDEVFLAFLEYAGTSLSEIAKLTTYEAIKARVEAASIKISKQIFAYWSQNRHLKVEFSMEPGRAGDPAPFNSGNVVRTRIHNKLHDMTVPFDDRSAGFTWFFSFLVMFSQVRKKFGNVIILLDEPGLNLHGKAQADLVRFIYEQLKGKHQVLYTTHSPFMVPSEDLASVRTVEDVVEWNSSGEPTVLGTKIGDKILSTDRDTLFPLQGALGYEITQSLFVGKHTLIVEGPADIVYPQAFSSELRRRKRTGLDPRWTICPAGGVDKIAAFISLFAGNKLHIAVLTDIAKGQKAKVEALRRSKLLGDGHVFTAGDFCNQDEADIEDLIGSSLYLDLINSAYELKGKNALSAKSLSSTGETSPRIVLQVEAAIRLNSAAPDFDHYAPAFWLIQHPEFLLADTPEVSAALDRFEALFKQLNALLPNV